MSWSQCSAPAEGLITGTIPSTAGPVKRVKPEEEPYEPVGTHAGAFLLKPSIEVSEGYDDNPYAARRPLLRPMYGGRDD